MRRVDIRKCRKCGIALNEENQYHYDFTHRINLCKPCRNIESSKYINLEKQKEYGKIYHQTHREQWKKYQKRYYWQNHEKCISKARFWNKKQKEDYEYILNMPDDEFIKVVRNFFNEVKE